MLCRADVLEGRIDEGLQSQLQIMDIHVELQKVPVELGLVEVQQIIGLALDVIHNVVEVLDHLVQPIKVGVLSQRGELMNGGEHADQLLAALGEEVKLVEDLGLIEVKGCSPWLSLQEHHVWVFPPRNWAQQVMQQTNCIRQAKGSIVHHGCTCQGSSQRL